MLVMKRRVGESILIGDDIEVEVLDAGNNRVKLGIRAPREITVVRKEIELVRQENLSAAASDPALVGRLLGSFSR